MASPRVLLIVCVLLVSSFAPITVSAESNDSRDSPLAVKIGFLNEITGPLHNLHSGWTAAAEKAIADLNADGGNFELVMEDSGCNAVVADYAAQVLVEANVVGVAGPGCNSATMAALPVLSGAGIPMISWYGTSPQLGDESSYPGLLFRLAQEEYQQGEVLSYVVSESNSTNPAILRSNLNADLAQSFNLAYERDVGTPCAEFAFDDLNTDFSNEVSQVLDSGCDSVVLMVKSEQASNIISEIGIQGFSGEIFASYGILEDFDYLSENLDWTEVADGIEITSPRASNVTNAMNEFVSWCTNNTSCNYLFEMEFWLSSDGSTGTDYVYDSVRLVGESYLASVNNGYSMASSILLTGQMREGASGTISLMDNGDSAGKGWDICELSYSSNLSLYCNETWYPINNFSYVDSDGDGFLDWVDDCPDDPDGWSDGDHDGACNNTDGDDDGDGWSDTSEIQCGTNPLMFSLQPADYDSDSVCDLLDADDDNDGYNDTVDDCPFDANEHTDSDGDGFCDVQDTDDDNDGWTDAEEQDCVTDGLDADSVPEDYDSDGLCNGVDDDSDGDGIPDVDEYQCNTDILDSNSVPIDTDGDSICDPLDDDDDGDGIPDGDDAFPLDIYAQVDTDSDGLPDRLWGPSLLVEDDDDDNDGFTDNEENECNSLQQDPTSTPEDFDFDGDGICDSKDDDDDGDGVGDREDAFPLNANETLDYDSDGNGDNSDEDDDNDGVPDPDDLCPTGVMVGSFVSGPETDRDSDGCMDSDLEDLDDDNDGVPDSDDLCPLGSMNWTSNQTSDFDGDGCRDADEDTDDDNDGFSDWQDTCPFDDSQWEGDCPNSENKSEDAYSGLLLVGGGALGGTLAVAIYAYISRKNIP